MPAPQEAVLLEEGTRALAGSLRLRLALAIAALKRMLDDKVERHKQHKGEQIRTGQGARPHLIGAGKHQHGRKGGGHPPPARRLPRQHQAGGNQEGPQKD